MGLLKLISNRISTEWKEKFNKNIDYLNDLEKKLSDQGKATNSRIDNLVLHSGGDSPNEVVDARVNSKGKTFDTLNGRLIEYEDLSNQEIQELNLKLNQLIAQVSQLNGSVQTIIGGYNESINIYVSKDGNDQTGDGSQENPFLTIQTAVNSVPLVTTSTVIIWISDGVYLEDVLVNGLTFRTFIIRPLNDTSTLDPQVSDCPVKIRSIMFATCTGYCQIVGMQIVDTANSPLFQGRQYGIVNEQSGYMAISQCKFAENTKSLAYNAVYVGGTSKMNMYGSTTFINQDIAIQVRLLSEFNVGSLKGSGNNIGVYVDSATARYIKPDSEFATTENKIIGRGLIINTGKVL
ncbi:hypothetical protein [Enterococcus sp. C76]|uniref:hypothetical protein n=1 Tax=Enterococcus sp. C76 TaxID=3231334 RepID=UPI0034A07396